MSLPVLIGPAIEDVPVNQVEERKEHASLDHLLSCSHHQWCGVCGSGVCGRGVY